MATRLQQAVDRGADLPGQVKVNEGDPDVDPRIATPHAPVPKAPKYKSADGKKIYTPTHVRTAEWYERHGFKKA